MKCRELARFYWSKMKLHLVDGLCSHCLIKHSDTQSGRTHCADEFPDSREELCEMRTEGAVRVHVISKCDGFETP